MTSHSYAPSDPAPLSPDWQLDIAAIRRRASEERAEAMRSALVSMATQLKAAFARLREARQDRPKAGACASCT